VNAGHKVKITTRNTHLYSEDDLELQLASPDWSSEFELSKLCSGIDVVIHAAGINAINCQNDPALALEFNGNATGRLVDASVRSGVKSFVYLSTAHVYSNTLSGFVDEDSQTNNEHPYATSHLLGESKLLSSPSKMNMHVIRLSNVFGPPANRNTECWSLFMNDISRQVAIQNSITLTTDGSQLRDFVAMSDFLNLINKICQGRLGDELPALINFGSGKTISLLEVAQKVRIQSSIVFGCYPEIVIAPEGQRNTDSSYIFGTKYGSLLDIYKKSNMDQEICELLEFTKYNFSYGASYE
jgi:UDP-glucose 4-epimerase